MKIDLQPIEKYLRGKIDLELSIMDDGKIVAYLMTHSVVPECLVALIAPCDEVTERLAEAMVEFEARQ